MKKLIQFLIAIATLLIIAGCGGGSSIVDSIRDSVFTKNSEYLIVDNGDVASELNVESGIVSLTDIKVYITYLNHERFGDLKIALVSPSGISIQLVNHNGGDSRLRTGLSFSKDATVSITDATEPFDEDYLPITDLSNLDGTNPNGIWHLTIEDDVNNGKEGVLKSWSIIISGVKE